MLSAAIASGLAAYLSSLAVFWWRLRRVRAKAAEDLRRAQDERAEVQTQLAIAVTETFTRIREKVVPTFPDTAPLFDALIDGLPKGAPEMVTLLRERMQMLKAGLDGVQDQVTRATQNELAVRADNTLLRMLLERHLNLPPNTPQSEIERLRRRITESLGAAPPNHLALADAHFRDLAERIAADAPLPPPRWTTDPLPERTRSATKPKKKPAPKKRRSDA